MRMIKDQNFRKSFLHIKKSYSSFIYKKIRSKKINLYKIRLFDLNLFFDVFGFCIISKPSTFKLLTMKFILFGKPLKGNMASNVVSNMKVSGIVILLKPLIK